MCDKFKVLVLVDLGGTIFFRSSDKDVKGAKFDFKHQRNMYFYRPGHSVFLKSIFDHPRIKLAYYSSIMKKNIVPALSDLLSGDLEPLKKKVTIFD